MQVRCRKSLVWISPLILLVLAMWGGAWRAEAKALDASDLSWLQDDACAGGATFAALETPDWMEAAEPAADASPMGDKECADNKQCKGKQYCAKSVGDCKGKGKCTAQPDVCTDEFKPVCGCNGKTYSNACFAAAAGVNVAAEGACKTGSYAKACKTNKQCGASDYCAKDTGKCDDDGMCAVRPHFCPTIVAPVCGCNKKTFNNACEAHRAGVNVKHDGKCEK
ncbi:MAG TPA: Kazal-type serine protease inhibitor domain-containing protein [Thermoanaerobaculia bacterium]|jgi:hypothetical protein|nr:Kazal-type serine protease inhibitor domain-containing protein [Thermoanaerobaculia bacterium]